MKTTLIILINFLMISTLVPTTWVINQDGTGHFTFISVGIMVAQNGDTLLVHPGVYYERLNYEGKNITITSLYDGDQYDESYIANTIIDGNHEGSVVVFNSGETRNAVLNGFTIRNGEGDHHYNFSSYGGGIYVQDSSPIISNCIITKNRAYYGAAIGVTFYGNPLLRSNRVFSNHSLGRGAIYGGGFSDIEFCQVSRNSIYLNFAGRAADIFLAGRQQSPVVVDTLTVLYPDRRFVAYVTDRVPEDFTFTVNHGKIEPVAADLYVSPTGSNANSGLTPDDPLQTIAMALIKIAPDSLQQRTIHVAEGLYSRSLNNQTFPIGITSFINIIGANKETTILDLEDETHAFDSTTAWYTFSPIDEVFSFIRDYTLKNFTIINGGNPFSYHGDGAIKIYLNSSFILENINIYNCHTGNTDLVDSGSWTISIYHSSDIVIKNLHVYNCSGQEAIKISTGSSRPSNFYLENVRIRNIVPGPLNPYYAGGTGGGMTVRTSGSTDLPPQPLYATIVNLEVTDCVLDNIHPNWGNIPWFQIGGNGPSGLMRIINATIGNNYSSKPFVYGLGFWGGVDYELINSIVYGNVPNEVLVVNVLPNTANINISHSLIKGGEDGIHYVNNPNSIVHWGEGNIDADPMWLGDVDPDYTGRYPYKLHPDSPAIDTGTLNIPGFEFPEYDLAGNPRIYGDSIDMGAYEWNPLSIEPSEELISDLSIHDYRLHNYPNPIVNLRGMGRGKGVGTNISFVMPEAGRVVIDIYNLKGQFVRRVFNAYVVEGQYEVLWDGRDEQERVVATGFYMYQMQINGKTVASGRCTFVK